MNNALRICSSFIITLRLDLPAYTEEILCNLAGTLPYLFYQGLEAAQVTEADRPNNYQHAGRFKMPKGARLNLLAVLLCFGLM